MRHGGEKRGNSTDRANRKRWLLATFGNGTSCDCRHCRQSLTAETLQADRIEPGGSYCHSNLQPSCRPCNLARSQSTTWAYAS